MRDPTQLRRRQCATRQLPPKKVPLGFRIFPTCFLVAHWRRLNCVGSLKVLNNVTLWAPNLSFNKENFKSNLLYSIYYRWIVWATLFLISSWMLELCTYCYTRPYYRRSPQFVIFGTTRVSRNSRITNFETLFSTKIPNWVQKISKVPIFS